jgi:hypothetical protein
MWNRIALSLVFICAAAAPLVAQTVRPEPILSSQEAEASQNISTEVSRIARAVEALNRNWKTFFDTFNSNQGLRLEDRQQKLLMALELLNRLEQSLANMQKFKLDLIERQSGFRLKLASVTDDLLPQSIDRYVALRGTTNAEELRDIRRQALIREQRELTATLSQIQRELDAVNFDIARLSEQVRSLRGRIFGQVEKELSEM